MADWGKAPVAGVSITLFPEDGSAVLIDELRLYTRALSAEEIRHHMQVGGPLRVSGRGKVASSWGLLKRRGRTGPPACVGDPTTFS